MVTSDESRLDQVWINLKDKIAKKVYKNEQARKGFSRHERWN